MNSNVTDDAAVLPILCNATSSEEVMVNNCCIIRKNCTRSNNFIFSCTATERSEMQPRFIQQPEYTLPHLSEVYWRPLKYTYLHIADTQQCPL